MGTMYESEVECGKYRERLRRCDLSLASEVRGHVRERERESGGVSVTYWIVGVWDGCYTIMSLAVMMEAGGWLVAWGTTSRKEAFTSLRNTDKFFVNLQGKRINSIT